MSHSLDSLCVDDSLFIWGEFAGAPLTRSTNTLRDVSIIGVLAFAIHDEAVWQLTPRNTNQVVIGALLLCIPEAIRNFDFESKVFLSCGELICSVPLSVAAYGPTVLLGRCCLGGTFPDAASFPANIWLNIVFNFETSRLLTEAGRNIGILINLGTLHVDQIKIRALRLGSLYTCLNIAIATNILFSRRESMGLHKCTLATILCNFRLSLLRLTLSDGQCVCNKRTQCQCLHHHKNLL